jgi:hypothetical protein
MGYLSEIDGDHETADVYYQKARTAERSGEHVTVATRRDVVGMKLEHLAQDSDKKVNAVIDAEREAKRHRQGPIQLKRRDNTPVREPGPGTSAQ